MLVRIGLFYASQWLRAAFDWLYWRLRRRTNIEAPSGGCTSVSTRWLQKVGALSAEDHVTKGISISSTDIRPGTAHASHPSCSPSWTLGAEHLLPVTRVGLFGGLTGDVFRVVIAPGRTLFFKTTPRTWSSLFSARLLRSGREASFYQWISTLDERSLFPVVKFYVAERYPDESSLLVMEDHSEDSILGGKLLGNQCWPKDPMIPAQFQVDPISFVENVFDVAAKLHARYWCDESLLGPEFSWLKASDWIQGKDRVRWEYGQWV